jgi:hypothetical protein
VINQQHYIDLALVKLLKARMKSMQETVIFYRQNIKLVLNKKAIPLL